MVWLGSVWYGMVWFGMGVTAVELTGKQFGAKERAPSVDCMGLRFWSGPGCL